MGQTRIREDIRENSSFRKNEGRSLNKDVEDVSKEFKDVCLIVQMPRIHFVLVL